MELKEGRKEGWEVAQKEGEGGFRRRREQRKEGEKKAKEKGMVGSRGRK